MILLLLLLLLILKPYFFDTVNAVAITAATADADIDADVPYLLSFMPLLLNVDVPYLHLDGGDGVDACSMGCPTPRFK